jgi:hypothetical protein
MLYDNSAAEPERVYCCGAQRSQQIHPWLKPAGWSEREAAVQLTHKFNASGDCLPSLTLIVKGDYTHDEFHSRY